jgi:DNA-binding NarL/FixJ family response regulator
VLDPTFTSTIRVFLLVENRFLRESLARLFRKRSEIAITGQASPSEPDGFSESLNECDVVVGDCFVPGSLRSALGGASAAKAARVVLIGMRPDEEDFLTAVRAGVSGYLLADASAADVVSAVRAVFRGEAVCPPRLCSRLFNFVAQSGQTKPQSALARPDLTLRQQQLLSFVAKGLTNKEIASQLNLSEFTVRNHIHRILKHLDAETRAQAVETVRAYGSMTI